MLRLAQRVGEVLLALVALGIAGLSYWTCYDVIVHPPDTGISSATAWAIIYAVGFLATVAVVLAVRLAVPRFRVEGDHILGFRGVRAFALIYGLLLVLSLAQGNPAARRGALTLALGAALGIALRRTFGVGRRDRQ